MSNIPWYPTKADFNTNSGSFYDTLARFNRLMILLEKGHFPNYTDPLKFLNFQRVIGSVPTTELGTPHFIQGFSINQAQNELYVVRKENGKVNNILYRYNLATFTLIDKKEFATSTGAFNEGLPYFYNRDNELCFIVRVSYDHLAAIFNYTKGTLSDSFVAQGASKHGADWDRKYYFTGFGDAERAEGVFLYDFNSVVAGKPILLRKIFFPISIAEGEKVQSMTMLNDKLILAHGKQYPGVTVMNLHGVVEDEYPFEKSSLADMLGVKLDSYSYENEGIHLWEENGKVTPIISHVVIERNRSYFTVMGSPADKKVRTRIYNERISGGLNWIPVTTWVDDATNYSNDVSVQYAKDAIGNVHIRGVATFDRTTEENNVIGINKTLFTLPFPYAPYRNSFYNTVASGGADRVNRISVNKSGAVVLESYQDQGGTAKPFTVLDGIVFHVDTRPN